MAYGTRWEYTRADHCVEEAEKRALIRAVNGIKPKFGFLYRFEEHSYASSSGWDDDDYVISTYIELTAYPIRKPTPQGWTIPAENGLGWRFVSKHTTKQFALPTIELALKSYIARKERQASIYDAKANKARNLIARAKAGLESCKLLPDANI